VGFKSGRPERLAVGRPLRHRNPLEVSTEAVPLSLWEEHSLTGSGVRAKKKTARIKIPAPYIRPFVAQSKQAGADTPPTPPDP